MCLMLIYFFKLHSLTEPLNDYSQLEEMLALRKLGWSYTVLADRFNVPKTTIRYLCRKFGLAENIQVTVTRPDGRTTTKTPRILHNEMDEVINPGKSYAEYLQDERDRKWRRLTQGHLK